MSEFTPGPWISAGFNVELPTGTKYLLDNSAAMVKAGELWANARLIAAAPELLAALEALLPQCVNLAEFCDIDGSASVWAFIEDAADAIAKATT